MTISGSVKPLRITWGLSSSLVTNGNPIHLDALVAFAKTQQALAMLALTGAHCQDALVRDLANELPLQKDERNGNWVWKASAIELLPDDEVINGMRFWTRKTDPYDIAMRTGAGQFETTKQREKRMAGQPSSPAKPIKPMKPFAIKIDQQRGLYLNMYKFYPVKTVSHVRAWCIGDPDELESLLHPEMGYLTHIGPRKRSGHGCVKSFEMVEDERAESLWQQRVLPWPHDGAVPMSLAVRPPYWAPENRCESFAKPSLFM